ncbi:TolC family protein [Duganella sp. FT135W]|uniref:Protein CyaE n=2 Tax=Duganella flavida TaxID=2692175 RepID=A0A6L8K6J4_9BURK|nr:TolC family protein [Duganella flavida]
MLSAPAWAQQGSWLDRLSAPLPDPLRVQPPQLAQGATLPGDASPLAAAEAMPASLDRALSLADAVDLALSHKPQVQSAWASIKLQASALGEARAAYLPTASATVSRLNTHTAYDLNGIPATSNAAHTMYAALNWRLFDFGTRAANRQSANQLLAAALAQHEATLQQTLAATIQAYFDVESSHAAWQAKEQSVLLAHQTLDSAQRREQRGAAAQGDTLQAGTALARALLERNRSWSSYRKAVATLAYAIGVPAESELSVADEEDDGAAGLAPTDQRSLADWMQQARGSHPAIQAARASWQAAQSRVGATVAEGLPTLDLSLNYYRNGYPGQAPSALGQRVATLGLSINVPLFDGFSHSYKVRGAQAQAEQRAAELDEVEHQVLLEVVKAHAETRAALQNLQASQDLLTAARDAQASARRRYEHGAADLIELLSSQNALADAIQERVRCLAEWRSARLRLLADGGVLGHEALLAATHRGQL